MFNSSLGAVKYRVYCTLEGKYFEVWDTHKPTRCPNCPNFDIEVGCISRVNDVPYAVYGNTGSNDCEDGPMQVFITNPEDIVVEIQTSNLEVLSQSNVYFTNERLDVNNLTSLNDPDYVHLTNPEDITFFLFTSNITVNTDCNIYFTNERLDVSIVNQPIDIQNLTTFVDPDFVHITNSNIYITNENIDVTITGQPIDIQNLTSFADPDFVQITNSNLYITNENIDVTITGQPINVQVISDSSNPDFVFITNSNLHVENQTSFTDPDFVEITNSNLYITNECFDVKASFTDSNIYITNENIDVTITGQPIDIQNLTSFADPDFIQITNSNLYITNENIDVTITGQPINVQVISDSSNPDFVFITNSNLHVENQTSFTDPDFVQITNSNLYITNECFDVKASFTDSNVYITNENIDVTITGQPIDIQNLTSFADPDFVQITNSNLYITNENIDVTITGQPINVQVISDSSNPDFVFITNSNLHVENQTSFTDPDFVEITNSNLYITNECFDVKASFTDSNIYITNENIDVTITGQPIDIQNLTSFADPDFVQITNSNLYITNENIDVTITGQPISVEVVSGTSNPNFVFVTNSNLHVENQTTFNDPDYVEITNSNIYITNENIDVTITGQPIDVQNLTTFADPDFVQITNSNLYITNENIDVTITGQPIQVENTATFSNPDFVELTNSNIYFTNERLDTEVLTYRKNDYFDVLNVDMRHNYIYNYSEFGVNRLRNYISEVGGATLSNEVGDNFYLLTSSNAGDMVSIESNELVPFEFGFETFNMIGHLQITPLAGNNRVIIGLIDSGVTDGWFFEINVNGLEAVRVRNSVELERTNQSSFNIDNALDGTGPSGITWTAIGVFVYAIKVLGQVTDVELGFATQSSGRYGFVPVHKFAAAATLGTLNRYTTAPLTVMLDSNGTANNIQAAQLLRITQIIGDFNFQKRITSIHRPGNIFVNITSSSFQPIISIRKKSNFSHIKIELEKMDIIAENTMEVAIFFDAGLTGPVWGPVEETDNNETCLEQDYTATAMTLSSTLGDGIVKLYSMIVTGGGNQTGRTTVTEDLESFRLTFGRNNTLTVGARTLANNAAIYLNLRVLELW